MTEADLRVLVSASNRPISPGELRHEPARMLTLLDSPRVQDAVFQASATGLSDVSPFLMFVAATHRLTRDLAPPAPGSSTGRDAPPSAPPSSEVRRLADFLASPARRLFLAELLASFTVIGPEVYPRERGLVERHIGLDPVELSRLLDHTPEAERPGIYRRLGDLALFTTGVFPDRAARHVVSSLRPDDLIAALAPPADPEPSGDAPSSVWLLERLGSGWYRAACQLAPVRSARLDLVGEIAQRFSTARRVLNQLARRYLFRAETA